MVTEQYRVELRGHIDGDWSAWLSNLELTHIEAGNTILIGDVVDQAALHGLLARIRDLGIPILLVARQNHAPGNKPNRYGG